MDEGLLTSLQDLVINESGMGINEKSILGFYKKNGLKNLIWLKLNEKEIKIVDYSDDCNKSLINKLKAKIKSKEITMKKIHDNKLRQLALMKLKPIFMKIEKDKNGDSYCIIANDEDVPIEKLTELQKSFPLLYEYIVLNHKISYLEGFVKGIYSEIYTEKYNSIDYKDIPQKFIEEAIPVVIYSVANEIYGPTMIQTIPEAFNEPENLIIAIKIFSTLDSEMIGKLGHSFSINNINNPTSGEIYTILFTIANKYARGEYELHAISLIISQDFENISHSILIYIKAFLFSKVEEIRQTINQKNWNLYIKDYDEITNDIKSTINSILNDLRKQVVLMLASFVESEDLKNWKEVL